MVKLNQMIIEARETRFHRRQYLNGIKGACIEALACAIREIALEDAKRVIMEECQN